MLLGVPNLPVVGDTLGRAPLKQTPRHGLRAAHSLGRSPVGQWEVAQRRGGSPERRTTTLQKPAVLNPRGEGPRARAHRLPPAAA